MLEKTLPIEADVTLFRSQLPTKRRQSRRQRCDLATMAKLQLADSLNVQTVWVYNLSLGGVGLNSADPLEAGRDLTINFKLPDKVVVPVAAKVVFCRLEADNSWRIGCEFQTPLGQDILDVILG